MDSGAVIFLFVSRVAPLFLVSSTQVSLSAGHFLHKQVVSGPHRGAGQWVARHGGGKVVRSPPNRLLVRDSPVHLLRCFIDRPANHRDGAHSPTATALCGLGPWWLLEYPVPVAEVFRF